MKKKTPYRQVEGLKTYAAEKQAETEEKINRTIDQMKQEGQRVSFSSVAGRAGVSRTTLYSHERIRERIQGLSAVFADDGQVMKDTPPAGKTELTDRIKALKARIKRLESEKEKLVIQLVDHYDLQKENERLRRQLGKGHGKGNPMPEEEC